MISDEMAKQESDAIYPSRGANREEGTGEQPQVGTLLRCLDRIARLQNTLVDQLDLQEAAAILERPNLSWRGVKRGLSAIARRLGSAKPRMDQASRPSKHAVIDLVW